MSAFCEIIIAEAKDVLAIPIEAVKKIGEEKWVTLVKETGTTEEVKVETGISNDSYVEIKSGLTAGQKVQYTPISKNANENLGTAQGISVNLVGF